MEVFGEYKALSMEELGMKLFQAREAIRELEARKTEVQKMYDEMEYVMIEKMQEAGLSNAGIPACTFSLKVEMYPQVKDIDAFVRWAADNNKAEMLQRRVSAAVFREYFEQANQMPDGVDTFEKTTLGMRKR